MLKRLFDIVASFLGLLLLFLLFVALAILIKLESPGPVFYRGLRAGRYGKPFRIFKFRTMVVNADKIGGPSSSADDPRITRVGNFLRRYKLDELPQLLNVLRGEMSLVGPRPEVVQEVLLYTEKEKRLLEVRPGITDWASIRFRNEGEILRGSADPHAAYREKIRPEKIRLGLEYVQRRSFLTDCKIIFLTLKAILEYFCKDPRIYPKGNPSRKAAMSGIDVECRDSASLAKKIRVQTARMIHRAKSSHLGSAYSMADLLAVLYGRILRIDPKQPEAAERDRFVLSKGHACAALYAVLAERGFFPKEWLEDFYQDGARLAGHATHVGVPGVEVSTGSLGHGLPIACGMALTGKRDGCGYRVFAVLSDGECDEGSTWEAVLFAGHHRLDNLIAIVDYNKIQSLGTVKEVLDLEPFAEKWRAFRWGVREIDGHDLEQIERVLSNVPFEAGKPTCVVAHTVKGKGVSFMENKLLWHYRAPDREEMAKALAELGVEG